MHSIGILAGGAACADLLAQALPPGLWERCRPACTGGMYDLLVVAPDWPVSRPVPPGLTCRALLLPGRLGPLAGDLEAGWVMSYGLTPRDSLTLSSLGQDGLCLALQREVVTLAGRSLEPQETPLRGFAGAEPELVLAWAGVMLLVGVPVERISRYDFDGSAVDISAADSKQ